MDADHDMFTLDPLALAICERFLEEWRAGLRPRLSVYVRRYPTYAAALADLVASLPPDAHDAPTLEQSAEMAAESFPERLGVGDGVSRALQSIFDSADAPRADARLRRVAEERSVYRTGEPVDPSTDTRGPRD